MVSFTIVGTNEAATIGDPTVASVTDGTNVDSNGNLVATGSISVVDPDHDQSSFQTTVTAADGDLGSLTLNADGTYTYTVANSAVEYLQQGESKTDSFTVTSLDGTTKLVSFTIIGTNEAATIGDPTVASVTDGTGVDSNGNLVATGSISVVDPDHDQSSFQTTVTAADGDLGSLTLNADGTYVYTVSNAATEYLQQGESKTDTFTVTSLDGTTKDIAFTIVGTNEAATIGDPTVASVTDGTNVDSNGNLVATGSISVVDPDHDQSSFQTTVTAADGDLGSLTLNADGTYVYTVSNAATEYLQQGESKTDTFTVTSLDGTTKVVSFTIVGTNEAAAIGDPTVASVTDGTNVDSNGNLVATGSISVVDPDHDQSSFQTTVTAADGDLGSLTLNADGTYVYTVANSAVEYLQQGESKTDSFTVTSLDGTTKLVSFTIVGTNEAATIGDPTVASVTDGTNVDSNGNLVATGSISVVDPDHDQSSFQTTVTAADGDLGSLILNADGTYVYTVSNAATEYLQQGESKIDTFTITSLDGTTKDIAFTIVGTNEAATIGDPTVASVTDGTGVDSNGNLVATGSISVVDPDHDQSSFQTTVTAADGDLGSLTLNADGTYVYTVANSAVEYLQQGESKTDSFTVTSLDGTTKVVSFTIVGTNEAATIGDPTVASVTDGTNVDSNGNLVATGSISVIDPDHDQSSFQTTVTAADGDLGSLTLNADGTYVYTVSNAATEYLQQGESKTDTFTVTSLDGTTKLVSFTIIGTNEAATIGDPTVASVTDGTNVDSNGNLVATGSISVVDPDHDQSSFQTTVTAADGDLGSLTLNADGTYVYTVSNAATEYLQQGESKTDSFTVTSLDGTTKVVSFTIVGTNEAATIGDPTVASVTDGTNVDSNGNLVATGSISVVDPDHDQSSFQTAVTAADGDLGSLTLNADGTYVYTVANSAVEYLQQGESKTDTFTVTSLDGTTKLVSFTIVGTNEAATIGDPTVASVTDGTGVDSNGNLVATGSISVVDPDHDQSSFQTTVTAADGDLGSLTLNADGTYTLYGGKLGGRISAAGREQDRQLHGDVARRHHQAGVVHDRRHQRGRDHRRSHSGVGDRRHQCR